MYLSAMLRKHGHRTVAIVDALEARGCVEPALREGADIFAFSRNTRGSTSGLSF